MDYLPIFCRLDNKPVLLVGGGEVAERKARLLLDAARREQGRDLDTVATIVGEASQALRFNQRVLEAALENMSQGISVVDAQLQLVAWNSRYAALFKFPPELLQVGQPVANLVAAFLVADDRIPCRQADRTRVRRIRQWTPEVILGPRRVACQVTGHSPTMPVIRALGKRDSHRQGCGSAWVERFRESSRGSARGRGPYKRSREPDWTPSSGRWNSPMSRLRAAQPRHHRAQRW